MISHQKWVCVFKKLYLHVFPQPLSRLCTTNVTPMGFCPPPGRLPGNQRWLTFASRVSGLWHIMTYFITWKFTYVYIFSCILLTKICIFFHVLCFYFINLLVYSSHSMLLITTCSAEPDRGNKLQQASLPPYLQDQFTLLACDWQLRKKYQTHCQSSWMELHCSNIILWNSH